MSTPKTPGSSKPDPAILAPIDERITRELKGWNLEQGVAYWRWATCSDLFDSTVLPVLIREHGACGGYSGIVVGKPLTALFFYPCFE